MICESCGTENPPGARFCGNPHCQAYLAWSALEAGSPAQPETPASSGAVKPGSLHTTGSHHPHLTPGLPPTHAAGISLTAAATQPAPAWWIRQSRGPLWNRHCPHRLDGRRATS